jgi:hypothetical protein
MRVGKQGLAHGVARGLIALGVVASCGCEDEQPEAKPASWVHPTATASQQAAPSASVEEPSEPVQVIDRPIKQEDLALTDKRRKRTEAAIPEMKEALMQEDLEQKLFKLEFKRGAEDKALEALDRHAKGKWVLFTGNVTRPTADGFELPVRYTPKDPNDPMGLTSNWFFIKFDQVMGYKKTPHKEGELTAVLAKYEGGGVAKPAYDLVLLGHWMNKDD